jgi:hypothetical protein
MKALRYLSLLGGLMATMLATLAATASAAPAPHLPPPPDNLPVAYPVGGMPGWEITLIAVGAALTAAILAILVDRAWSARRRPATVMQSHGTAQAAVGRQ